MVLAFALLSQHVGGSVNNLSKAGTVGNGPLVLGILRVGEHKTSLDIERRDEQFRNLDVLIQARVYNIFVAQ